MAIDPAKVRLVGGLTCREVMAALTDYADGDVDEAVAHRIEAHVAGCDTCATFGQGFGQMLTTMRRRLREAEPLPADVAARLQAALVGRGR